MKLILRLARHSNRAIHDNFFHTGWMHFVELFLPISLQLAGPPSIHSRISPLLSIIIIEAARYF
jgi:hypothetical protein